MDDDGILEKTFNRDKDDWSYGVYTKADPPVFLRVKDASVPNSAIQSSPKAVQVYNGATDNWEQGDGEHLRMITTSNFKTIDTKQECLNAARRTHYTPPARSSTNFDPNAGNHNG